MNNAINSMNITIAGICLLSAVLTTYCSPMATETSAGRYLNNNDSDATHFIELYDDHTFIYYYQKDTLVETFKSTWQFIQEKDVTKIFFSAWRSFGP